MSGQSRTAAAGASKVPAAPPHPGTLLRPPNPPPPPPCTPPATAKLGVPAAGQSAPAGCMYAPAPPAAPAAPAPPPPPPAPVACKGAVVDEEAYPPPPPPPEDSEVDVLPPYPEEDLGLPAAPPRLSLPPVTALPVPPGPLPATSQVPESDNPSQGVYQSTAKLQEQQQQQEAEEGIRRLQSKYASPGTLLLTPQAPLPPDMAAGPQGQGAGAPLVASPTAAVIPRSAVSMPFASLGEGLTDDDIVQVEMFYRSHKTEVHVCRCLANLYFSSKGSSKDEPEWEFSQTGIPLLLLDSGEHHRQRKLVIILAEKGTGFTLWRDPINHLTKYCAPSPNFHTLHLSKDHTRLVGLSFDDQTAATEFLTTVVNFTSDPDDALMNLSKSKKDKKKEEKKKKKKEKYKPPKKTDISQPCCFVQITKLERPALGVPSSGDQNFADSMNNLQLSDTASSQGSLHNL